MKVIFGAMAMLMLVIIHDNSRDTSGYKMRCSQKGKLDVCVVYHRDGWKTEFYREVQ